MQVFDLEQDQTFKWQDGIYKLKDNTCDPFLVICVARPNTTGELYPVTSNMVENFNPYADVEPGRLILTWETKD